MIIVVDYGMGNLLSVTKAFKFLGEEVSVSSDPKVVADAEKVVLPGVGAFGDAVLELKSKGLFETVIDFAKSGRPFLGVCLGLQLLLEGSEESEGAAGLGLIAGKNIRFQGGKHLKVPQIGWNNLQIKAKDCPILKGIHDGDFFYFVHSYFAVPVETNVVAASTDYGVSFPSVLWRGNIFATQFHPEKSQKVGLQILKSFAELKN